mgnify:FL=1|tara:strand:- start:5756 stop:7015 length:1260 start_codon:yes stop_codon:yes gene_type:complete
MGKILTKIRLKLHSIRNNRFFEFFVVFIIILSALNIGLSTFDINPNLFKTLNILDYVITFFFLIEILIRMYSYEKVSLFFKKKWNIFDFTIVLLSLIPLELFEAVIVARLLRVFRLLRIISFIPQFRVLIESLAQAIPRVSYVLLFIFIETYIFAAIGSILFGAVDPEHWDNIGVSMLTLFKVGTIDGWIEIMNNTLPSFPNSWFYYVLYIIITGFIFLNMVVGVIIDVMIRQNTHDIENSPELMAIEKINKKVNNIETKVNEFNFGENNVDIHTKDFSLYAREADSGILLKEALDNKDTKITVGIIIRFEDRILLLQRPQGTWALPKGHVKEGEENYDALLRELEEETQIKLDGIKAEYLHETKNKTGSVLHIYYLESENKLIPIINSEHIGWAYFSLTSLPDNIDYGLNKYLQEQSK